MRAYQANDFCRAHTHGMTTASTTVMFAPYNSRVVSRSGSLRPLAYLPGTSVGKKLRFPPGRFSTSTHLCVARSFADPVVCRTLVRRPRDVSHAQYHLTIPSVIDAGASLDINRALISGCSIHTSSIQLHIIKHVDQLKFNSSNYNHINIMHSITHNIIPVHRVI